MASRLVIALVLVCLLLMAVGFAIPKPDEEKQRVVDKPLSTQDHYTDEEHNKVYDHDAILGEDEAKTFEELSPKESRERLKKIVDRMDKDTDGYVSHEELQAYIRWTQRRYVQEDVDRNWKGHNPNGAETIDWDTYRKSSYGFLMEGVEDIQEGDLSYREMMRRDKRRWAIADTNGDGALNLQEFTDFLHPEDAEHMTDVVIVETMEDIDKDGDGKISLTEYIGDMYRGENSEEEPEWVRTEREQFGQYRDKDGDGLLNKEEVRSWILPPDYDHSDAEAKHLIYESDLDKDNKLTKDEILNKYDLFVGSQATDFGEALNKHDEF